jgi:hypothetical protein
MLNALANFFSPEAGQSRRRWLNEQEQRLGNALSYYLGPAADPIQSAALLAGYMTPGADMMDASNAGRELFNAETPMDAATAAATAIAAGGMVLLPGNVGALREGFDQSVNALAAYDPTTVNIFAGPRAATADLNALARAQEMRQAANEGAQRWLDGGATDFDPGADYRTRIWNETGWFQGPDGNWRFEIDDSGRRVDIPGAATARGDEFFSEAEDFEMAQRIRARAERLNISTGDAIRSLEEQLGRPVTDRARVIAQADTMFPTDSLRAAADRLATQDPYADPFRMAEVMQHPGLFAAYPDLAHRQLTVGAPGMANFQAAYVPEDQSFFIQRWADRDNDFSLGHETQHYIQDLEGWAPGGNESTTVANRLRPIEAEMQRLSDAGGWQGFNDWYNQPGRMSQGSYNENLNAYAEANPDDAAFAQLVRLTREAANLRRLGAADYKRLAGEVEARAVQARRDMTPAERAATPPWASYDVSEDRQLILNWLAQQ